MSEDLNGEKSVYCKMIENSLRESEDMISRIRSIDGNSERGRKVVGSELEELQDNLFMIMRYIDDIRGFYYESVGYGSIH